MTLTAFVIRPDEVEIVTDTASSGPSSTFTLIDAKQRAFPTLDAVVHGRGAALVARQWEDDRAAAAMWGSTFDAWHDDARATLPELWASCCERKEREGVFDDGGLSASRIFHFGWSDSRERFVAIEYDSGDEFTGHDWSDHDGVWIWAPRHDPGPVPKSDAEWVDYIARVRDASADPMVCATVGQWQFGGELLHTRLRRGEIVTRRIHRFADDWPYRRQFIGTLNYRGQLGPCVCGSGQPMRVCHLVHADQSDKACACGSGELFRDCHLIDPQDPVAQQYWFDYIDDFDRDREAFREAWLATQPDDPLLAAGFEPQDVIGDVRRIAHVGQRPATRAARRAVLVDG
jgi:hypothetical protein